ncbi:farnesyl pyrophosphate synthase [Lutzomyia longipalpis]|uniref:Farnesyl pyrophosphate synthase n=1 Tax=Lutzomyia longipalpis TaxID=7200 RepID=A0A1B0CJ89_LUTLO|nr:farnesyl pyrophosphate synthase [Lutzomyia longipalpis]
MFSVLRNPFVQNLIKPKLRGDHLAHLRCITTSSEVNNSDYLKKNDAPEKATEGRARKATRTLSTIQYSPALSKDKSREFMSYFPDIVRELKDKAKQFDYREDGKHFARVLQYNAQGGKKNRGVTTAQTFELIAAKSDLTEENRRLAIYLGWCVELLQALFLLMDDIMDGSTTRRGQLCWYKQEDVQLSAVNDGLMIEAGIYQILKKHFSHLDCYVKLLELFHEMTFITTMGQHLDTRSANVDILNFTMELYKTIVLNKTAWYSFYMPVAAAMHLAGYKDDEAFRQARTILLEIGYFFQIQDDFLDCYGDPEHTGKIGTDIQDGKCTWLAVVFLQRATAAQKALLKESYGKNDAESVERVKKLYDEVSLPNTYQIYEEDSYNMIKTHIQQTSRGIPVEVYLKLMDKLYRRTA